jgi:hypothetical protein
MNGDELKVTLKRLGLSQVGAARFLGHDGSTVRRWIAGKFPIPHTVEMLLRVMVRYRLTPDSVLSLVDRR